MGRPSFSCTVPLQKRYNQMFNRRMNSALRRLFTFLAALLLSFAIGVLGVAQNEWFGSGDLSPYAIYCIPFAVFLGGCSSLFLLVARRWPSWLAAPMGFVLGAFVGVVGTYVVAMFLGPWFGAMSVPILRSWCVAASFFIPVVYLIRRTELRKHLVVGSTAFAGLGVILFWGISPLWSLATGDQHLTTAFFRHNSGDQELKIDEEPDWLTEDDRDLLLSCGLKGRLKCFVSGGSNSTEWPRAKAFVIFTSDLTETVRLSQPKHSTILYVQRGTKFIALPNGLPTLDRAIEFYQDQSGWSYRIEQSSGAKSGGSLSF
jgi:hypothetical protein